MRQAAFTDGHHGHHGHHRSSPLSSRHRRASAPTAGSPTAPLPHIPCTRTACGPVDGCGRIVGGAACGLRGPPSHERGGKRAMLFGANASAKRAILARMCKLGDALRRPGGHGRREMGEHRCTAAALRTDAAGPRPRPARTTLGRSAGRRGPCGRRSAPCGDAHTRRTSRTIAAAARRVRVVAWRRLRPCTGCGRLRRRGGPAPAARTMAGATRRSGLAPAVVAMTDDATIAPSQRLASRLPSVRCAGGRRARMRGR